MKPSLAGASVVRCCRLAIFVLAITCPVQSRNLRRHRVSKPRASYEVAAVNDDAAMRDDATVGSSRYPASPLSARIARLRQMQKMTDDTIAAQRHAVEVLLQETEAHLQKDAVFQHDCDNISATLAQHTAPQDPHTSHATSDMWLSVVPPTWLSYLLPSAFLADLEYVCHAGILQRNKKWIQNWFMLGIDMYPDAFLFVLTVEVCFFVWLSSIATVVVYSRIYGVWLARHTHELYQKTFVEGSRPLTRRQIPLGLRFAKRMRERHRQFNHDQLKLGNLAHAVDGDLKESGVSVRDIWWDYLKSVETTIFMLNSYRKDPMQLLSLYPADLQVPSNATAALDSAIAAEDDKGAAGRDFDDAEDLVSLEFELSKQLCELVSNGKLWSPERLRRLSEWGRTQLQKKEHQVDALRPTLEASTDKKDHIKLMSQLAIKDNMLIRQEFVDALLREMDEEDERLKKEFLRHFSQA
eukprot:TRINITY_DN13604_c0_g2_i1.p1 TRINITY_DN13604_c0_g2~~TRINITY_DN13604_c0_g2_i1.p1  ORF type:complete len:467 (-),score=75.78 TRINITY_DN13604_c0_g2_i1:130-1530(-)